MCKECGKTFTLPDSVDKDINESLELDKAIYKLLLSGYSTEDIAKRLDIEAGYFRERIAHLDTKSGHFERNGLVMGVEYE